MSSNDVTNKLCVLEDSKLPTWLPFICRWLFVWAQGGLICWMFLTLHLSNYFPTSAESVTKFSRGTKPQGFKKRYFYVMSLSQTNATSLHHYWYFFLNFNQWASLTLSFITCTCSTITCYMKSVIQSNKVQ